MPSSRGYFVIRGPCEGCRFPSIQPPVTLPPGAQAIPRAHLLVSSTDKADLVRAPPIIAMIRDYAFGTCLVSRFDRLSPRRHYAMLVCDFEFL